MTELIDKYNRRINYLRISVTDRCNLRCLYCMPAEGIELCQPENILRYEELLRVARIAASRGVTKIRVTGGEPLVRKGLVGFIREVSSISGVEDLSLTTNGVLLKDYALRLKEAGLKRVNVSLDTLNRERFKKITRGDRLDDVLEGLDRALEAGLTPVKVNMVVIKGFNDDEVLDFALMSKQKPFHIRFIEYMPFDTEEGWQRDKCMSVSDIKAIIEKREKLIPAIDASGGAGPARRFRFKGADGEVGFISPVTEHFCGECNRLRLTADGKLRVCLFSDSEIDLRTALRDGSDDAAIEKILFHAVAEKPAGHHINENIFKKCSRTMSLIGG
ncbi:MAG: GTP 3',8-cyclase MoaA [Thermodesulfobacteriota bacterium]|nr:MAG: GTP 3',8-cyclase MoaA [Thermodesulfobacteriota bacterium]